MAVSNMASMATIKKINRIVVDFLKKHKSTLRGIPSVDVVPENGSVILITFSYAQVRCDEGRPALHEQERAVIGTLVGSDAFKEAIRHALVADLGWKHIRIVTCPRLAKRNPSCATWIVERRDALQPPHHTKDRRKTPRP